MELWLVNQLKKQRKLVEKTEEKRRVDDKKELEGCLVHPMSFIFSTEQISSESVLMQTLPPIVPSALWVPAPFVSLQTNAIHQATLVFHPIQYCSNPSSPTDSS